MVDAKNSHKKNPGNEADEVNAAQQAVPGKEQKEESPLGSDQKSGKENKDDQEKKKKVHMTLMTEDQHRQAYPDQVTYEVKNTLDRLLSVELCSGRSQKMWAKDKYGNKVVAQDIPEPCKTCPGRHIHLGPLESQEVGLIMPDCFVSDQTQSLVNNSKTIKVKAVDKETGKKTFLKTL